MILFAYIKKKSYLCSRNNKDNNSLKPKSRKGIKIMKTMVKGSAEYKQAQNIANQLTELAGMERMRSNKLDYIGAKCDLDIFMDKIAKLSCFAAQVAETVKKSLMNPYGYTPANISSKQAWVLACAAVEFGIEL